MSAAPVIAITDKMDRRQWLEARRGGIGGSDAAVILGLSSYQSPLGLYLEKTGQLPVDHDGQSEQALWGQRLESVVADAAVETLNEERERPLRIRRRNAILRHPDDDLSFAIANIDRVVQGHEDGQAVLEVKTVDRMAAMQWEPGELPEKFHVQTQHYLGVTGWRHAFIAVLVGGNRLRVERVERDEALISALWQVEADFWQRVVDRRPPPADSSEATKEALAAVYPTHRPESEVLLPDAARDLLEQRAAAVAALKAAEARQDAIENSLRLLIGDAERALLPGVDKPVFTYKTQTREGIDAKALREAHPDIAAEFTKTTTFRRFNFTKGVI